MHFTLYNPPTQLFSSVSLSAEMLPTGGLTLSSLLESVTIFCSDSAPLYHILLPEVSSLGTWTTHGTQELHPGLGTLLHPGLMPYPQLDRSCVFIIANGTIHINAGCITLPLSTITAHECL